MDELINLLQGFSNLSVPFNMSNYRTWGEVVLFVLIIVLVLVIYILNKVNRLERRQIDFLITRNNKKKEQENF